MPDIVYRMNCCVCNNSFIYEMILKKYRECIVRCYRGTLRLETSPIFYKCACLFLYAIGNYPDSHEFAKRNQANLAKLIPKEFTFFI